MKLLITSYLYKVVHKLYQQKLVQNTEKHAKFIHYNTFKNYSCKTNTCELR